jgi:hypothetical protein
MGTRFLAKEHQNFIREWWVAKFAMDELDGRDVFILPKFIGGYLYLNPIIGACPNLSPKSSSKARV